ncbi:MAG: hypothetical protein O3A46_08785 [Candidatus Poribacteria bacterium]|nr:hypothetical protein [Candidatus Poribacteria bacterium]
MSTPTREAIRKLVDELPDSELAAAQEALQRLFDHYDRRESDIRNRERYEEDLLESGLLVSVPPPLDEETRRRFHTHRPITVKGTPLSERIIEERR